jgi:flagellin-like protein
MLKGLSPLIAIILLIAFTVAVAGIISVWLTGFARTQTELVGEEAEFQLICSYAGIALSDVKYGNGYLAGIVENVGTVVLGNISLHITYLNASSEKTDLCIAGNNVVKCSVSNITLFSNEIVSFNISIGGSNYDEIRVAGNCSTHDEVERSEVKLV